MSKDNVLEQTSKGQGGGKPEKPQTYAFFVGREKFETDQPVLTGLQIKAKVPRSRRRRPRRTPARCSRGSRRPGRRWPSRWSRWRPGRSR